MLDTYLLAVQNLLQSPAAPTPLYDPATLTTFINTARGQLAGEGQCIRLYTTLAASQGVLEYPFSSISLAGRPDIAGIINIRTLWRALAGTTQTVPFAVTWTTATGAVMTWTTGTGGSVPAGSPMIWTIMRAVTAFIGQVWMTPRQFEWFSLYELNNAAPQQGPPQRWSQFGQGASGSPTQGGTLWVSPVPDGSYTLTVDAVCYPVPLVDDTTPEALPYLWTDAVPYFAAYLAYLSAQSPAREANALRMFQIYTEFVARARRFSTPGILPGNSPQNPNLSIANQLGISPPQRGAA